MLVYAVILFAVAAALLCFGARIGRGNTRLIHDYHQTNVKEADRPAYGRAFAKGLYVLGAALVISGVIALLGQLGVSLAALAVGLVLGFALLVRAQKRYNGGLC